ncbi:hypothetical protein EDM54_20705 [Brevibacillus borstelensis]|nr:hypothetical protein EDM54_20705 [Brevibacillus borstelensis]
MQKRPWTALIHSAATEAPKRVTIDAAFLRAPPTLASRSTLFDFVNLTFDFVILRAAHRFILQ